MRGNSRLVRAEIKIARRIWGEVGAAKLAELRALIQRNGVSVALGDICYMENRWYITHAGLVRLAHRKHCIGIKTNLEKQMSDPLTSRWVFRAVIYTSPNSVGFVGYGDADPSNTSPLVRGAEMRVAETRAVNRALRKAYGIGVCSVEELGSLTASERPLATTPHSNGQPRSNGSSNGQPRLRDQLCLLIRQHNLDPKLVKSYAADFCGTATLSGASKELVESFISHLSSAANENRDSLVCKLNSYSSSLEARA